MPMPVSRTVNSRQMQARTGADAAARRTSTEMLPAGVNLTALLTRLEMTCQSRVTSPMIQGGTSGAMQ